MKNDDDKNFMDRLSTTIIGQLALSIFTDESDDRTVNVSCRTDYEGIKILPGVIQQKTEDRRPNAIDLEQP